MFARYLLLLALAVCCRADDILTPDSLGSGADDSINVAGLNPLLAANLKVSFKDPYADVAKCSNTLLSKALVGFDLNQLANTGLYSYIYSSGVKSTKCVNGDIYGDEEIGFRASATLYESKSKSTNLVYDLSPNEDGTIDETLTLDDGSSYDFKLVPLAFEKTIGVFYYGRCSTEGKSDTESRSIVINQCNAKSNKAKKIVDAYVKRDASAGYKGDSLDKLQICNK
uniref:Lipocalin/cytosolic fatty-acid binding domain-containing protein n=1 Tax=Clastoptera arizonana TaxID=38151 RepID=A0A1B6C6R4_9HEMI